MQQTSTRMQNKVVDNGRGLILARHRYFRERWNRQSDYNKDAWYRRYGYPMRDA